MPWIICSKIKAELKRKYIFETTPNLKDSDEKQNAENPIKNMEA